MGSTLAQKCSDIRDCVADRIGLNKFRTWFGDTTEFQLEEGERLDVLVDNSFVGKWIASNFLADLAEASREVLGGRGVDIRIVERTTPTPRSNGSGPPDGPPVALDHEDPEDEPPPPPRPRRQAPLRGQLQKFIVGPSNQLAFAAASQMAGTPGQAYKLLILHGGCGLGKTHLLQGICNAIRTAHPTQECCYISGEEFTNEFIYAVKRGRIDLFRARFRSVDVLVIDDIHFLRGKKATQDEFLHTFDAIDAAGTAVVLSSDKHPRSIATLSEPLINRLISGMVVEIAPPDFATRREILVHRAAEMKQSLPDAVIDLVAGRVVRNVRELEGALFKLVALASLLKEPISTELAETTLADHFTTQPVKPSVSEIENAVVQYFGVTGERIRSKSRDRTVSLSRAVTMYLIRKHSTLSFPEIGRLLGGKNHSTVLMATQRIERQLGEGAISRWTGLTGPQSRPLREILEQLEGHLMGTDGARSQ